LTSASTRGHHRKVSETEEADHYSWEEVYDLLGVDPEMEPAID